MCFKFVFFIKPAKCTFFDWKLVQFDCMMCLSSFEFFVLLLLFFRFSFYKLHVVQLTLFTAKCSQRQISTKILTNK